MVAMFPPHQQQSARSQMPQLAKRLQAKLVRSHIIIIVPLLYRGHIALYSIHLVSFQDHFSVFKFVCGGPPPSKLYGKSGLGTRLMSPIQSMFV